MKKWKKKCRVTHSQVWRQFSTSPTTRIADIAWWTWLIVMYLLYTLQPSSHGKRANHTHTASFRPMRSNTMLIAMQQSKLLGYVCLALPLACNRNPFMANMRYTQQTRMERDKVKVAKIYAQTTKCKLIFYNNFFFFFIGSALGSWFYMFNETKNVRQRAASRI